MLALEQVTVEFISGKRIRAVEGIDMFLEKGSKTSIIGETGSGKSVLLLAVLKMLPHGSIINGRIIFKGRDLTCCKEKEMEKIRGNQISYIPQGSGNALNPLLKIGFQVGEALMEHRGYSEKQALLKGIELLKRFNVGEEEKRSRDYPHTFSGGMKQRALIAMGVSAGAELILADEPTKGLDKSRTQLVVRCFKQLEEETILFVTHDLEFAYEVSEYISVMYAAQQVEYAKKEDFYSNPLHPYSQALVAALPENGLHSLVGFAPSHETYNDEGCRFYTRCHWKSKACVSQPPLVEKNGRKVRCWRYVD